MRGGISKKLVSMETTTTKNLDLDPVSENAESSDDTGSPVVTLGASATIGSFTLDAVVSQEILLTGPDFIGGNPAALNSKIAAKYVW